MILAGAQVRPVNNVWVSVGPLSLNSKDIASLNSTITPKVLDIKLINGYQYYLMLDDMSDMVHRLSFITIKNEVQAINILHVVGVSKISETTSRIHLAGSGYLEVVGTLQDVKARLRAFLNLILGEG